jgi:hypothetical protein
MQEVLEKRRQAGVKTGRASVKRGEEYGVCGWGANRVETGIATDPQSIGLHSKKRVLDEQILFVCIKIASFCIAAVRLLVSLRQPLF